MQLPKKNNRLYWVRDELNPDFLCDQKSGRDIGLDGLKVEWRNSYIGLGRFAILSRPILQWIYRQRTSY